MKNWKTTTAGLMALLAPILTNIAAIIDSDPKTSPDLTLLFVAFMSAVGLFNAQDSGKKTGK